MSDLTALLDKTEQFERLVLLAQQCAPAFFAILFALVIPVFGQRWLVASLEAKIADDRHRSVVVETSRRYWRMNSIFSIVLVAVAILWFFYVQVFVVFPDQRQRSRDYIQARIDETWSRKVFEGYIYASADDVLMHFFDDPNYRIYIHPEDNHNPRRYRFVVLRNDDAPDIKRIKYLYMTRSLYDVVVKERIGVPPAELEFCMRPGIVTYTLRSGDRDVMPTFDPGC
ncbi:hypothetical protein [Stella sp.]|uniref:hypothetical protein n=1 Tax=Stella sp. TaxID=2912054 RepID=UPI0035B4AE21